MRVDWIGLIQKRNTDVLIVLLGSFRPSSQTGRWDVRSRQSTGMGIINIRDVVMDGPYTGSVQGDSSIDRDHK